MTKSCLFAHPTVLQLLCYFSSIRLFHDLLGSFRASHQNKGKAKSGQMNNQACKILP